MSTRPNLFFLQIKRPKKFKRVRTAAEGDSDEDENDRDAIATQLFDDDADEQPEVPVRKSYNERPAGRSAENENGDDEEDYSDTDSFIGKSIAAVFLLQ